MPKFFQIERSPWPEDCGWYWYEDDAEPNGPFKTYNDALQNFNQED